MPITLNGKSILTRENRKKSAFAVTEDMTVVSEVLRELAPNFSNSTIISKTRLMAELEPVERIKELNLQRQRMGYCITVGMKAMGWSKCGESTYERAACQKASA